MGAGASRRCGGRHPRWAGQGGGSVQMQMPARWRCHWKDCRQYRGRQQPALVHGRSRETGVRGRKVGCCRGRTRSRRSRSCAGHGASGCQHGMQAPSRLTRAGGSACSSSGVAGREARSAACGARARLTDAPSSTTLKLKVIHMVRSSPRGAGPERGMLAACASGFAACNLAASPLHS